MRAEWSSAEIAAPATDITATAASDDFPGYHHDAASGWYINTENPAWQYDRLNAVFYNASENVFYRQDPVTLALTPVDYTPGSSTGQADTTADGAVDGAAAAAEPAPTATGLGKQPIMPHIADYTFMQGRRPTQEDRHTIIPDYGVRLNPLELSACLLGFVGFVSWLLLRSN